MTPEQVAKIMKLDAPARAEHNAALADLDAIPTDSTNSQTDF